MAKSTIAKPIGITAMQVGNDVPSRSGWLTLELALAWNPVALS